MGVVNESSDKELINVSDPDNLGELSQQIRKISEQMIDEVNKIKKVPERLNEWVNSNKDALVTEVLKSSDDLIKTIESLQSFGDVGVQTATLLNETDAAVASAINNNASA